MPELLRLASRQLYNLVNWFIPPRLRADAEMVQGIRMFLISHFFGPFLGHTVTICILYIQGKPDWPWVVLFLTITLFWAFSFLLRFTGWYVPLAFLSIQNLLFIILWGCYFYGGTSSPILPWLITVPLLAFFYLPSSRSRIQVSLLIVANLVGFYAIYKWYGFPADGIPLDALSGLGFVSTFCAGTYVSMMALYYANVVSSQSELEQEVQRHLQTARELTEATELAQQAMRAKSEFLSNMSHELRTPLNAIIGYSEMLIEDSADDQQLVDLEAINGAGQNLLRMINELLDLSKLEAGKMELHVESFALRGFIDQVARDWAGPIERSGSEFRVDCAQDLGEFAGDAAKLAQVFGSLLANAAKYAGNGRVTLTVTNRNAQLVAAVRDTGPGIHLDRVGNLFEAFGQQEGETSSIYRETPGLGLPLSQRLCRLMGGELSVASKPGHGSCFTVRVPSHVENARGAASPQGGVPDPGAPVFGLA